MKKQLRSFGCAFRGIGAAIRTEGHLRFHLVAAFYVLLFSLFYDFSAAQYAVLFVLIPLVIAAELVNSAVERVCDLVTKEQNPYVRAAKDMAAGAVLVLSIGAAATACIFFLNFEKIGVIVKFFAENPVFILPLTISAVLSVLFGWKGGKKQKNKTPERKSP